MHGGCLTPAVRSQPTFCLHPAVLSLRLRGVCLISRSQLTSELDYFKRNSFLVVVSKALGEVLFTRSPFATTDVAESVSVPAALHRGIYARH